MSREICGCFSFRFLNFEKFRVWDSSLSFLISLEIYHFHHRKKLNRPSSSPRIELSVWTAFLLLWWWWSLLDSRPKHRYISSTSDNENQLYISQSLQSTISKIRRRPFFLNVSLCLYWKFKYLFYCGLGTEQKNKTKIECKFLFYW